MCPGVAQQSVAAQTFRLACHMTMPLTRGMEDVDTLLLRAAQLKQAAAHAKRAAVRARLRESRVPSTADRTGSHLGAATFKPRQRRPQRKLPALETILEESCSVGDWLGPGDCLNGSTTIVLWNIPGCLTEDRLVEVLDSEGFAGRYESVTISAISCQDSNVAVLKLMTLEDAESAKDHFKEFNDWYFDEP